MSQIDLRSTGMIKKQNYEREVQNLCHNNDRYVQSCTSLSREYVLSFSCSGLRCRIFSSEDERYKATITIQLYSVYTVSTCEKREATCNKSTCSWLKLHVV